MVVVVAAADEGNQDREGSVVEEDEGLQAAFGSQHDAGATFGQPGDDLLKGRRSTCHRGCRERALHQICGRQGPSQRDCCAPRGHRRSCCC